MPRLPLGAETGDQVRLVAAVGPDDDVCAQSGKAASDMVDDRAVWPGAGAVIANEAAQTCLAASRFAWVMSASIVCGVPFSDGPL